MGYDLHITRRKKWNDAEGPLISADEWVALLDADPELLRGIDVGDGLITGTWKGERLFQLVNGEVIAHDPNPATIEKMVQMARTLGATVQGDEGEIYPEAMQTDAMTNRSAFWRRMVEGS